MRRANRGVNNLSQPRGLQHPATARKLRGSPEETGNRARQERNGRLPRFSCTTRPHPASRTVGRLDQARGRGSDRRSARGGRFRPRFLATALRNSPAGNLPRPDSYGTATVTPRFRAARRPPPRRSPPNQQRRAPRSTPPVVAWCRRLHTSRRSRADSPPARCGRDRRGAPRCDSRTDHAQ